MKEFTTYLLFLTTIASGVMIFKHYDNQEIYQEQKELIKTQKRLIKSLRKDLITITHYPESQQAEHIIYRERVNALADSMLLNYSE